MDNESARFFFFLVWCCLTVKVFSKENFRIYFENCRTKSSSLTASWGSIPVTSPPPGKSLITRPFSVTVISSPGSTCGIKLSKRFVFDGTLFLPLLRAALPNPIKNLFCAKDLYVNSLREKQLILRVIVAVWSFNRES